MAYTASDTHRKGREHGKVTITNSLWPSHAFAEDQNVGPDEETELSGKIDLLTRIPLFAELDSANRRFLASASEILKFETGEILFRQGDVGKEAYVIVSGEAEIVTEGPEGDIVVATIGPNQFFGEIAILIDAPRTATVSALSDLTTLMISKEMFYSMVSEFPAVGIEIMRQLAQRLLRTTARLGQPSSDTETIRLSG